MAEIIAFPGCRGASDKRRDRDSIPTQSAEILFFLGVQYVRDADGAGAVTASTVDPTPAKPTPAPRRRTRKSA